MTIVVDGKPAEHWLRLRRKQRLLHSLYWFLGVVAVGLIHFAAPHPIFVLLQLGCWIGVAVSLVRAWRSVP